MIPRIRFVRPEPTPFRRVPAILAAVLVAGAPFLFGCSTDSSSRTTEKPGRAVPVTVGTAARKDVPIQIRAIGTVEAYSTVSIKSMVAGSITKVGFREGQDVRKGDLLFEIDPVPYRAALKVAEATLARDVALKENAAKEANRYERLIEQDLVPRQQYDQAAANLAALEATVNADAAMVEQSRVRLAYCFLRSPIDGRTGNLSVNRGNIVKENDTVLVVIHQITPIYVAFSVPEQRLAEIRRYGASARLAVDSVLPGEESRPVHGTLDFIGNAVDKSTGTIPLKAKFANADRRLWPGQFVNVSLVLTVQRGAVVVPTQALQTGQAGQYLFVVRDDHTVEMRSVTTGQALAGETVVEQGVSPGEQVVTDGQLGLVPGSRIEIKHPKAEAEQAS